MKDRFKNPHNRPICSGDKPVHGPGGPKRRIRKRNGLVTFTKGQKSVRFLFGEHKGKILEDIPLGYVQWALKTIDDLPLKKFIAKKLKEREVGD